MYKSKIIAIENQKGGTGKSTTTLNLGVGLAREGKKVLLILVNGGTMIVPDADDFTVWGGVYLHGRPKGDTSYESNGSNNTMTLKCHTKCPLSLVPITPNASYREGTTVISSFWLKNKSGRNFTQTKSVTARFTVKKANGTVITTVSKTQLVVPGNDQNLVYIKWDVPTGLNNDKITIDAVLSVGGITEFSTSKQYSTIPYTIYATPDTQYERSAPSGFTVPNTPSDSNLYASWWQYTYSNGDFVKRTYCIGLSTTQIIVPKTGETDFISNSQYVMKSGYGIGISASGFVGDVGGYTSTTTSMYTQPQYVLVLLPEFGYKSTQNTCRTLIKSGSQWIFRTNEDYGNVHFTPLYFPDGSYTVSVKYSDIWTPGGMISVTKATNTIKIEGSAYDDWYIGR